MMEEERKVDEVFDLAHPEDDYNVHSGDKLNQQTAADFAKTQRFDLSMHSPPGIRPSSLDNHLTNRDQDRLMNLIIAFIMYRPDIGYLPVSLSH
jgi:hypothetical protein